MSVKPTRVRERRPVPHVISAMKYSFGGFRRLLWEQAFRQEVLALLAIFAAFATVRVHAEAYLVQLVLFLLLASIEALNTAIEVVVDRISPDYSHFAEQAKDLGSFAVFCLLCVNVIHVFAAMMGFAI